MYNWSKPITWREFKKYPYDIQKECLSHFSKKWGCSAGMFCDMMDIPKSTWASHQNKHGLAHILVRQSTRSDKEEFQKWLNGFKSDEAETVTEPAPVEVKTVEKEVVKIQTLPLFVHTLNKGNFTMSGIGNEIAQTLSSIFQNARVEMRVDFRVLPEGDPEEAAEEEE